MFQKPTKTKTFATAGLVAALSAVTAPAVAQQAALGNGGGDVGGLSRPEILPNGLTIRVSPFATVPTTLGTRLNDLTYAPGDDRIFVVNEDRNNSELGPNNGQIYSIDRTTGVSSLYFNAGLELSNQTGRVLVGGAENGLRSVAFHPEFETNGKFYTTHNEAIDGPDPLAGGNYIGPSVPVSPGGLTPGRIMRSGGYSIDGVLAEWTITGANPDGTVNATYREVFRTAYQAGTNGSPAHPIQQAQFNPFAQVGDDDYGLIYVNHGDNGTQNEATGQIGTDPYGKIFRINPLDPDGAGGAAYSVPGGNPFTSDAGVLDEVYALGFRNPAKTTFVQDANGDTVQLVFEIGEANAEEINIIEAGGNYGWRVREGTFANDRPFGPNQADGNVSLLPADDAANGFTYPAAFYGHEGAFAIARGELVTQGDPSLNGQVLFSDLTTGRLFGVGLNELQAAVTTGDPSALSTADIGEFSLLFDHDSDPSTLSQAVGDIGDLTGGRGDSNVFRDQDGVLYILNKTSGVVYRVESTVGDKHVGYQLGEIDEGLDTRGAVIGAFGIGEGGTVDGIDFTGDTQGALSNGGNVSLTHASELEIFESYDDGFTGDLATVLQGAVYGDGGNPILFELTGLDEGHRYLVQFLVNDGRLNVDRAPQIAAFGDNIGELAQVQNLDDRIISVEFISAGETQSFNYGPASGMIVNAYVISDLGLVPEPTSLALLGLGGLMLMMRRRRE